MRTIILLLREFYGSPLRAVARWQNYRILWLMLGGIALSLNLLAHYVFQGYMQLDPCELCVYIRFSMFCIFFGAMLAFIQPQNNLLRWLGGYILVGYGVLQGSLWDIKLEKIHILMQRIDAGADLFAIGGGAGSCAMLPRYPLGLPLHEWFPSWFLPTGSCGEVDWSLWGLNMAEALFLFYGVYIIALLIMIISWFKYNNSIV